MKLSKLFCNIKGFKNITFNLNGINVIYADVVSKVEEKKNSHDLGKTKLAELIDFMFLKGIGNQKKHFLFKIVNSSGESIFQKYVFYLELLLNSNKFLVIKRGVENNTKISFSLNEKRITNYAIPLKWDFEDISIKKAKGIFSEYINLDFFCNKKYNYRKAINYCIRLQGDYNDVYKLSKFSSGNDIDWKPFMFDLLGFNGRILTKKYENDKQREDIKNFTESLKKEYSIKVEDRDDYVAQLQSFENDSFKIVSQIDKFNFYEQDKELIKKGINEIETSISSLNSESYTLNYEISKLQSSINNNFYFNLEKVNKIFEESKIYFPDLLKKNYEDLLLFNNKLTNERNKLIKESLIKKQKELIEINNNLYKLNKQQEELLSYLQDTDTFRKFKTLQKDLVKIEGQMFSLKEKIRNIDVIIQKEDDSNKLLKEIEGTVSELRKMFQNTENNIRYTEIRNNFSIFYKRIMDEDARISWNINSKNNVEFVPPKVHGKGIEKKETAKDEGNTYKKLLCVAFDLAILCSYNQESYFRFVYHDDVLSQQDNGIKIRLLDLLREIGKTFDLQYILSAIKSDLPYGENDKIINFNNEEIILKLHDKDKSGTLFGFEF
jgi:uncharacterized protein YydD (DUF2326 family)